MSEDLKSSSTEILPNRQNLVDTAVNFLLNTDVKSRSEDSKIAFLRKKGLTESEITEAFEKAKRDPGYFSTNNDFQSNQLINAYPLPQHQRTYSFWSQLSRFSSSLIVFAVALYGIHRFYKLYIEPWLFGTKPEKDHIVVLEEQLVELNNSVSQLKETVSTLERTVSTQTQQIDKVFLSEGTAYSPIPIAVAELKSEITSVKSLLINRHNFPAVPKVSPSIPHWQLRGTEPENSKSELKEKIENGEDRESVSETSLENKDTHLKTAEDQKLDESHKSAALESLESEDKDLKIETNDVLTSDSESAEPFKSFSTANGSYLSDSDSNKTGESTKDAQ